MDNTQFEDFCKHLADAVDTFCETFRNLLETLRLTIRKIKRAKEIKVSWHAPVKIVKSSQVLNRKPRFIVARSNC
ncbi:hypothetical protein CHH55_17075 [Niallia circulans]|uniref:hypothetical protein n=1 Tax=Niallia circulans TaxID=1397 RepID=UPI000BA4E919|nr:hypothetical protein [Niallia circulans]PAD86681.1 hypothetical protein CHH55_17075 [Niallia circulans]